MSQLRRLSRTARIACLVAFGLFVGCSSTQRASAPVEFTAQPWTEDGFTGRWITTPHFEIASTLRDVEFEAALPGFLEAAYAGYQKSLPVADGRAAKLTTYVFGSRPEWEQFVRRRFPDRHALYSRIRSGGFTERAVSVSFYTGRPTTLATLAHEGWHQYVSSNVETPIPAWLNEGLACYHEAVDYVGRVPRFTPRHNTFRINNLRTAIQRDELLSVPELVDTDAGQIIGEDDSIKTQTYYAQAWALITYLRHGVDGKHAAAFDKLLSDLASGEYAVRVSAAKLSAGALAAISDAEAAFEAYFGCPSRDIADSYYDHLIRVADY